MVLYRVYSEPALDKYYSTVFSKATFFQILLYLVLIIPPFFIAYHTNDFWQYTSSYREQPDVNFLNRLFIQISAENGVGGSSTWSSFPNLNSLLQAQEIATPVIQSQEDDTNQDGKNDVLYLNITFTNLRHDVRAIKLLLFTNLEFRLFASTSFQSLVYLSQSWSAPTSRLWVGGALGMTQRVPFPAHGRVDSFNAPLLNTGGLVVEDFELRNILRNYNKRNVTTSLEQPLVVWEAGDTCNFALELELTYPVLTVTYYPGFWQLLKFAWIQYLAILVIFWWVIKRVQSFVFQNQVILTIKKKGTKHHKQ